ncbi:TPA: hypothetical protein ACK0EB_002603 [Staphylococcus aureus]
MNKNNINISFTNGSFNISLSENEIIDLRFKNDCGNIYITKIDDQNNSSNHIKRTGYSKPGLNEALYVQSNRTSDNNSISIGDSDGEVSEINNILNKLQKQVEQPKADSYKNNVANEKKIEIETNDNNHIDLSEKEQSNDLNDSNEKEDNIARRYMPIEEDDD